MGQHEILKCIILKIRKKQKQKQKQKEKNKKKRKRRVNEKYVAQKRVYLTRKEGIFSVFCQTDGCFHCFEFQGLTSWKTSHVMSVKRSSFNNKLCEN